MYRLATLAAKLKQPVTKVQSDMLIKGSGRMFLKHGDEYFAFKAAKDVIIPADLAAQYAKIRYNITLPPVDSVRQAEVRSNDIFLDDKQRLVLTLLGHFNHGKTSLLDALINYLYKQGGADASGALSRGEGAHTNVAIISDVVGEEKHGITQEVRSRHIAVSPHQVVTLMDTPGQEIFYRMRNTGSEVCDGNILVIAINDDIQQQTQESIGLVDSSEKPVIVCLNKVDTVIPPGAPIPSSLSEYLQLPKVRALEEECREYVSLDTAPIIPVSATATLNLDLLLGEIQKLFVLKYPPAQSEEDRASNPSGSGRKGRSRLPRLSRVPAAVEETKVAEIPENKSIASTYDSLTGRAYVLNLVHEMGTAPSLHVLVREGSIHVGDFVQAGGWMGRIRTIFIEEPAVIGSRPDGNRDSKASKKVGSTKSNVAELKAKTIRRPLEVAFPGMAVRLVANYLDECVDPRPVGEYLHAFSPKVGEAMTAKAKQIESVMSNEKKRIEERCRLAATLARDELVMEDELDLFRMSETQIPRFRLPQLFSASRLMYQHWYMVLDRRAKRLSGSEHAREEDAATSTDDSSVDSIESTVDGSTMSNETSNSNDSTEMNTETSLTEGDDDEEDDSRPKRLLIVRTRSDLELGTFIDSYYDYREKQEEQSLPVDVHLVQSGIGTISKSDVEIAMAAGSEGILVGYGVDLEQHALKEAKKHNVKILLSDNMPELLSILFKVNSDQE